MDRLVRCEANYTPLTPMTFLQRAATSYANRISVIYGKIQFTWKQTYDRCRRLAYSLKSLNISKNDVVSVLAPNVPALYEMHFAVPMAGFVLNPINLRLDAKTIATILRHSEAKVFFVDCQLVPLARDALMKLDTDESTLPLVIVIDDVDVPTGIRLGELEYEQLICNGNPGYEEHLQDEWDPISLNYTSGTTSSPKGVVYSHRGAYLSALSLTLQWDMGTEAIYLWSLPMFHCNGWTFTWGVAARGGTNVCIRKTSAIDIYTAISQHKVTHMCCAPTVFNILLEARPDEHRPITSTVRLLTGGAPPPATMLNKIQRLGFHVTHAYGLTEATGPALVCEWQAEWDQLSQDEQAKLKARQGVSMLSLADADVKDLETMNSVARDGVSVGEIVLRGSSIMKGYYNNAEATSKAMKNGWFHTGDVGVIHSNGYIEIKDRLKDVIISGGENISSVEVETILYRHPMVLEAAVVAMPHPRWGETPCAFINLKKTNNNDDQYQVKEADIISFCQANLPRFMVPKKVVFWGELPKVGQVKINKLQLREYAKTLQISEYQSLSRGNNQSSNNAQQVLAMARL